MSRILIGAAEMRILGAMLEDEIPRSSGIGFALLVFPFNQPGVSNYISSAQRADMIKALEETLIRFKNKEDFKTPEEN